MRVLSMLLLLIVLTTGYGFQRFPNTLVKTSAVDVPKMSPLQSCGISKVRINGDRIVGGRDALEGEFPWQISLRFKPYFFYKAVHICGGSILNDRWIITAAHCVYGRPSRNFEVAVGVYKQDQKTAYTFTYAVAEIVAHESFSQETFENDIALLRLKNPIDFSHSEGYINGICLPSYKQNFTGFVETTGWGSTEEDGGMSNTLQAVEVPVVPPDTCKGIYGGSDVILPSMLCAGEPEGGKDSCQGDSGGPLTQSLEDKTVLAGVVSFGVGCGRPGIPGVYTAVSHFVPWILTHAK